MKKLVVALLLLVMIFGLAGCSMEDLETSENAEARAAAELARITPPDADTFVLSLDRSVLEKDTPLPRGVNEEQMDIAERAAETTFDLLEGSIARPEAAELLLGLNKEIMAATGFDAKSASINGIKSSIQDLASYLNTNAYPPISNQTIEDKLAALLKLMEKTD